MKHASVLLSVVTFAFLAAGSRYIFRTIETRWQIVAWWALAALWQFGTGHANGSDPDYLALELDLAAVLVACTAMKLAIEGHF